MIIVEHVITKRREMNIAGAAVIFWIRMKPVDKLTLTVGVGLVILDPIVRASLHVVHACTIVAVVVEVEAYGVIANDSDMVYGNEINTVGGSSIPVRQELWAQYPKATWASEWHTLFLDDAGDYRKGLTWRNRCAGVVSRVSAAYNFYSSTEEVLRVDDISSRLPPSYFETVYPTGEYSWQVGEWYCQRSVKVYHPWSIQSVPP